MLFANFKALLFFVLSLMTTCRFAQAQALQENLAVSGPEYSLGNYQFQITKTSHSDLVEVKRRDKQIHQISLTPRGPFSVLSRIVFSHSTEKFDFFFLEWTRSRIKVFSTSERHEANLLALTCLRSSFRCFHQEFASSQQYHLKTTFKDKNYLSFQNNFSWAFQQKGKSSLLTLKFPVSVVYKFNNTSFLWELLKPY